MGVRNYIKIVVVVNLGTSELVIGTVVGKSNRPLLI